MKNKGVAIEKIELVVGGKTIPLSLDEAHDLMQLLNDTFGRKIEIHPTPIIYERPYRPIWYGTNVNTTTSWATKIDAGTNTLQLSAASS